MGAAEAVVTYCTSQTALEDAYFAEAGFVQAARSGTLLVDLSPSTPNFARELNAVALVSDLAFVEAPVVVEDVVAADAFARRENLVCFAAGEDGDVARAKPLLEALAADVRETGVSGSAQLARAAYTLQTAAQVVSAIEADALFAATLHAQTGSGLAGLRAQGACPRAQGVLDAIAAEGFSGAYTCEMFMADAVGGAYGGRRRRPHSPAGRIGPTPGGAACRHRRAPTWRRRRSRSCTATRPHARARAGLDARRADVRRRRRL